jgi:uncharacterized membrane protein YhaH (DUF805 family)
MTRGMGLDYLNRTEKWCFVGSFLGYTVTMVVFVFVMLYFVDFMVENNLVIPFMIVYVSLAVVLPFIVLGLRGIQLDRMRDAKKRDAQFVMTA